MNNTQIARQTSFKLILREAKNYQLVIAKIPRFNAAITRLEEISTEIDSLHAQQQTDVTGVTASKNELMENLMEQLLDVSGAMHSYGHFISNIALQTKTDFSESSIAKLTQNELLAAATIVFTEAGKIAPEELANEGITSLDLSSFGGLLSQCKEATSDPREALIDRKGSTQRIADLIKEGTALKKNTLNRLATQFKSKSPEFYLKYTTAANVIYKKSSKPVPTTDN